MISKLSLFSLFLILLSGCAAIDARSDRGIGENPNKEIRKVYESNYGDCIYLVHELIGFEEVQPGLELPRTTKYYTIDACDKHSAST